MDWEHDSGEVAACVSPTPDSGLVSNQGLGAEVAGGACALARHGSCWVVTAAEACWVRHLPGC